MPLAGRLWTAKNRINLLPGVYPAYRWATTKAGEGKVYTIRFGPMKGLKWRRRNVLPFWYHIGQWEPQASAMIGKNLRVGDTFWDVGANAGYHTIFAAREVGPSGHVLAFEPDLDTVPMIEDAVTLNGLGNVVIEPSGVSGEVGRATFLRRVNNLTSALGESGEGEKVTVPTVSLDSMLDRYGPPDLIKMDIEGGERDALQGARKLLSEARPRLLLSTHSDELHAWCQEFLAKLDYDFAPTPGMEQLLAAVPREG